MRRVVTVAAVAALAGVTLLVVRAGPRAAVADEAVPSQRGSTFAIEASGRDLAGIRRFAVELTDRAERQVPMPVARAVAIERTMATEAAADQLAAAVAHDLAALSRAGDRAQMTYWVAPLAIRVTT